MKPETKERCTQRLFELDDAHNAFASTVNAAVEAMKCALSEAPASFQRRVKFNGVIHFVGSDGDWHDAATGLYLDDAGELMVTLYNGEDIELDALGYDDTHSILKQFESQWLLRHK
jgi:hypothetical protein